MFKKIKVNQFLLILTASTLLMIFYTNCAGQNTNDLLSNGELNSQISATCKPPPGVSGSPKTFENVVKLINSLPKPVTISCFLQSLDRPLRVHATLGSSSAQPSTGPDNPRIFIMGDNLSMSVVSDGPGKNFLELGLLVSNNTSKKGEIQFPIDKNIDYAEPYNHLKNPAGNGTNCVLCHNNEVLDTSITFAKAYISRAIKPSPFSKMPIDEVRNLNRNCSLDSKDFRCQFLNALLENGEVLDGDFPANMTD